MIGISPTLAPGEFVPYVLAWTLGEKSVKLGISCGLFMVDDGNGVGVLFDGQRLAGADGEAEAAASEIVRRLQS
jgi:hypothetical protein